jgi:acyl-CoA synthetase (AMP-forming)/AMP-acid ligase II
VLPLSFDYGLSQLTTMALVGGTLVMPKAVIPTEIVRAIDTHDVNALAMVPTMWIPLVRFLMNEGRSLDRIRYVANSGGALPTDVQKAWPSVFPNARHYLMYGMTEGFRSTYLPPEDFLRKPGSVGVPLPDVEIYIVDDQRGLCGPGSLGQIIHRSSSLISSGYYRNPEATAKKIAPCPALSHLIGNEPVLYSGDTGHLDEDGSLYFAARTSAFIKCSDFRVSPTEVEDVVFSSGLVTDVVAFGRPDELLGQVVHLAVTGVDGNEADTAGILRHCKKALPRYAVPREIHVWDDPSMPQTANGKVDRPRVIERFS